MSEPNEPTAAYIPPPPNLPAVQSTPSAPPERTIEAPAKVKEPKEETEPEIEVNPEAAFTEWTISILKDALSYPTRKHGWSILIPGALLTIALSFVVIVPILGLIAFFCIFGFLAAYYLDIIGTSTNGDKSLPDWPVTTNVAEDALWPAMKIIGVTMVSFSPTLLYALSQGKSGADGVIGSLLYFLSAAYFPMACIALVMTDSLTSALPHRVLPAIKRCLPEYWVPVVVLILLKVITVFIEGICLFILPAFFSATLIALMTFYGLIIQARITGLSCQRFRERIQWG